MRRIFKADDLELAISEKGYALAKDLIPASVCDELSDFFQKNAIEDHRDFTISNWNTDEQYRTATYDVLTRKLIKYIDPVLEKYVPVMGVFTAKKPAEKSEMLLHQDWSLVDESKFRSVSVWVALCDVDHNNGNLQVAEYSHMYAAQPRGMNMPVPFEDIRSELQNNFLTGIPMKKGDAIIFDHRLIHASPPNHSGKIRLAAVLALIPAEAQLIHYYKHESNHQELEILTLDPVDFRLIDFFDMPNKPKHTGSLGMVPTVIRQIDIKDIITSKGSA